MGFDHLNVFEPLDLFDLFLDWQVLKRLLLLIAVNRGMSAVSSCVAFISSGTVYNASNPCC